MKQCPVRNFCCSLTKSFLALGLLLLTSGFVFCDACGSAPVSNSARAVEVVIPVVVPPVRENKIDTQQRAIKRTLKRIERRIENLQKRRDNLKHAEG